MDFLCKKKGGDGGKGKLKQTWERNASKYKRREKEQ